MLRKKTSRILDDRLDRIGRTMVRAAATNEAEADAAASSPFLYSRLRSCLAAEQERRAEAGNGWLAMLIIARRAVPTMVLVAAVAATLMLWFASMGVLGTKASYEEAFFDAREAGAESIVLAETGIISHDEVLAIVVNRDERGISR